MGKVHLQAPIAGDRGLLALDPSDNTDGRSEEQRVALEGFAEHAERAGGPSGGRHGRYAADLVCIALLAVATFAFYGPRLSLGVDLTDESYYATHLVDWLRNGFAGSQNRNLQQLSALILYAPTRLYVAATGGLDGLILFLRLLYAAMTTVAAVPVYLFLRRFGPAWMAALGAAFMIAFIPFGLPAPSYNTIALCGSTAGLCLFGLGLLDPDDAGSGRTRVHVLMAGAASAAAITALAYPTLVLAPPTLVVCALVLGPSRGERRLALVYAGWCCGAAGVTFGVLAAIFGFSRLREMAEFTSQSAQIGGRAGSKFLFSYTQISHEPFAAGAILGVILLPFVVAPRRCERPSIPLCAVFVVALAAMLWAGPVGWLKSHDVVLLGALFAPHVAFRMRAVGRQGTAARILVSASLVSGLITLTTANNGIFNFFVGGTTAAVLGLALLGSDTERVTIADTRRWAERLMRPLPIAFAVLAVGYWSQTCIYGEYAARRPVDAQRIAGGPFGNLWTVAATCQYVSDLTTALMAHGHPGQTLAVFGPYTAAYLLSPMRPWAYSTYMVPSSMGAGALSMTLELYGRRPPDVIVETEDSALYDQKGPVSIFLQGYKEQQKFSAGYLSSVILTPH